MKKILFALLLGVTSVSGFAAATIKLPPLPAGVVEPAFFSQHNISVIGYERGVSGLNVWQVSRNGIQTVFYSTADNKTLVSGVLWDASSGSNLSDAYITAAMTTPANVARLNETTASPAAPAPQAAQNPETAPGQVVQLPNGERGKPGVLAPQIASIDKLHGVKEGSGSALRTLYIMYDPRCPHCRNVYNLSREFIKAGGTIKWIPTTVLGKDMDGLNRVALVLQSSDPKAEMGVVEKGGFLPTVVATPETVKAVAENESYFWGAFNGNPSAGSASVPVAFFQPKDGSPQMVSDLDDPALDQRIFKDMR